MGIAKVGKSGGSGGVLNYVLKKEHAQIIGGNVLGTKDEIKEQFEAFETARSTLTKNTTHITWSFAPGEEVSDEKAVEMAEALLEKLKFEKTPYLMSGTATKRSARPSPTSTFILSPEGSEQMLRWSRTFRSQGGQSSRSKSSKSNTVCSRRRLLTGARKASPNARNSR